MRRRQEYFPFRFRLSYPGEASKLEIDSRKRPIMQKSPTPPSDPGPAGQARFEQHRNYLLRYATLHLRDPVLAEDAVQETLLAAIENQAQFAGKASVKTWLTSILKHKIIDLTRKCSRETSLSDAGGAEAGGDDERTFDALFNERDHWAAGPTDWGDPERSLEQRQFWEIFELCAKLMSEPVARVFMLREVMGLTTEEICKDLQITSSNCWVMLYRARMSLRLCLENKWFGGQTRGNR